MTGWFFLAYRSVSSLITYVELEASSENYDVQTICRASSVMSQTGEKRNPAHLMSSKHRNCLTSLGLVQPV